ncbi:NAD(P)-dependent oxidoreductase [Sphingobium sp. JS3065]|uniref:NAD-dependent epimerase/dehydratase family protein n=1 Tax=Sphingobium sp. JS3065 TaxID=2970925 RepID=UPI002264C01A|nr:NAD(P)-dependent oxidoreductase [Sphingobium sp. JS3065]UZW57062.1 NAD(P)-dependent oxidoreductase [Sphingobium sp. JS3065]
MRYFITGGTGLIGAYTTWRLIAAGHEVVIYDISPDRVFLQELIGEDAAKVRCVAGDITDLPFLLRTMQEAAPDRVIHLAALLGAKSEENLYRSLEVNCTGCLNIFEAALACNVARVVWASSVAVFGPRHRRVGLEGALPNDALHDPNIIYGACKSLSERFSLHYRRNRGLDILGLRFALVYGYGKDRTLARGTGGDFLTQLIDNPALGKAGRIPAGDAVIDFVYAEDAAEAVVRACEASDNRAVAVNVTGFRTTLRDAAATVRAIVPDAQLEVEDGSWKGTIHHYDATSAEREIGYAARWGIEEGFRHNIEEVRARAAQSVR